MSVRSLDSSFVVDLLDEVAGAVKKAQELDDSGERVSISPPAMAEVLMGAHFKGGTYLARALEFTSNLEVLPDDATVAADAGELGAEMLRRGLRAGAADLLVAANARANRRILVTRDTAFFRIPGLAVETY